MKKKIFNFTICLCIFVTIFFIFENNQAVAQVILQGGNLFFTKVFVSLFPMFIINDLLIALNIPYYFYQIFNFSFQKIFKTSGILAYILIMSLISGTPSSAYIIKNLVKDNIITINEANHFLTFTYFSNPLFLLAMLNSIFPLKIVIKIILIHYLSNIILALLLRKKAPNSSNNSIIKQQNKMGKVLANSITKAMNTLLVIAGTIIFYMVVFYIIKSIFNMNDLFKTISAGILEITNGLNLLATLKISFKLREIIAIAIISFGGLSINTQVMAILEDTNISFSFFFKGRILQVIISLILIIIF